LRKYQYGSLSLSIQRTITETSSASNADPGMDAKP
jgi:hypothetical protein